MTDLVAVIRDVCAALSDRADDLNALDAHAGDGDLGVTMRIAANAVLGVLESVEDASAAEVLRSCGVVIAREAPSTSGTLVASALLRAAGAVPEAPAGPAVASALAAARDGIAERGGAQVGAKTMLDALAPAAQAARDAGDELGVVVARAAAAADAGARATTDLRPLHGRAGWLAERSLGHEDAGARMVAIILAAAAQSIHAEEPA